MPLYNFDLVNWKAIVNAGDAKHRPVRSAPGAVIEMQNEIPELPWERLRTLYRSTKSCSNYPDEAEPRHRPVKGEDRP